MKAHATEVPPESYDYDANGNRDTGYTVIADNRTTQSPGVTYDYDDEGNITLATDGQTFWSRYTALYLLKKRSAPNLGSNPTAVCPKPFSPNCRCFCFGS